MAGMLDGKIALVTGAARGIGREAALLFAKEGATIIAADLAADGVGETVQLIADAGGTGLAVLADIADPSDAERVVRTAVDTFGRLDCAFNNAGVTGSQFGAGGKLASEWPEAAFDQIIRVNLKGVWLCMRAELEQMMAQGHGSIVNTASIAGLSGFRNSSGYVASKHGVVGLTKTAAIEYAPAIRVNCVCPGFTDTDLLKDTMTRRGNEILARVPFKSLATPSDIAEMACWLSSDRARYVNGGAFPVDGGFMAG